MSEPLRVLCVFSTLDRGGAESMCMNLYRNIDRSKVQFDFVKHTPKKCAFEDEITSLGGKIYEAPRYKLYNYIQYREWWVRHLKAHPEHQIIHGHYFGISAVYFQIAKHYNRITIGHSHCTPTKHNDLIYDAKCFVRGTPFIERFSTYCFACSQKAGEWIYPHRKFKVLNNAIDTNIFKINEKNRDRIRKEFGIKDQLVVGHIGRFFEQKNHSFLIDIFNEIHKRNSDSVLMLVGDGDLKPKIERRVSDYGLEESVIFTGVREDVSDLVQAMDCFAFPSLYEGLGIVAVEAQAAGLYCFLSETIPHEVDLTGRCVFLPINDPKIWAEKILTTNLTKVDSLYQIQSAGYDIHTTAKWLEKFYLKISERG